MSIYHTEQAWRSMGAAYHKRDEEFDTANWTDPDWIAAGWEDEQLQGDDLDVWNWEHRHDMD